MAKITKTRFLRKAKGINVDIERKVHWAEFRGVKFPVLMSAGQIVNIEKAFKKWKAENK